MATRPTATWRTNPGNKTPGRIARWQATDAAFDQFETRLSNLDSFSDAHVFELIEDVVVA